MTSYICLLSNNTFFVQMSEFETGYQALGGYYDDHDDQEGPPTHIIHAVPSSNKGVWLVFF